MEVEGRAEGPRCPQAGGSLARWFVALRCYAEECAISLSSHAQDNAWDLAEYKRVEPAHRQPARRPEGQAASENLCGYTTPTVILCARVLSLA